MTFIPAPRCVITGCDLVTTDDDKYAHGDLHKVGDSYVFNAITNGKLSCTSWRRAKPHADLRVFVNSNDFYEKRGVIVFDKSVATFSDAARDYMKGN